MRLQNDLDHEFIWNIFQHFQIFLNNDKLLVNLIFSPIFATFMFIF